MFYEEGSEWEIIIGSIVVIFVAIFQLWYKYDMRKNQTITNMVGKTHLKRND
jgi:hypothetical protein